jgi:hypothetical protein
MKTTLLDEKQFLATFAAPMRDVTREAANVLDIWPYVDAVPPQHLRGHEVYDQFVEHVYRDTTGRFDHVQVMTKTKNVYLTVVVDLQHDVIYGHHLLDLNEKYGNTLFGGSVMAAEPCFVYAKILDDVGPMDRGEKYEDPLQDVLDAEGLGELTGGGTMQDKSGKVLFVGIDIELTDLGRGIPIVARTLQELGAPPGSTLEYEVDGQKVSHPIP